MPSTYTCGTCRTSFESGRVNWSSPTCGPCEATARAQQRREGLSDARFMRQSPRGGVPRAPRGVPRRGGPPGLRQLLPHPERHTWVEHHRVRADPIVELPTPSSAYLATASEPSESLSPALGAAAQLGPLVVVLCLSRTLLYRPNGYTRSGQYAVVRPYLATFLSYLVRARARAEAGEGRRIQLVTAEVDTDGAYHPARGDTEGGEDKKGASGNVLELVLGRELLGLSREDYRQDVVTVKSLERVWDEMGVSHEDGAKRTLLLDEDDKAAAAQPHSRLPVSSFEVDSALSTRWRERVQELRAPTADDGALLSTLYLVELLRHETNVAAALRNGLVERVAAEVRHKLASTEGNGDVASVSEGQFQDELAKRGAAVCAEHGVEVRRDWDDGWKVKALGGAKSPVKE